MFPMTFLVISIWFGDHTCQIIAFYIEFEGIKNPLKDGRHCLRLRRRWSFLTGADVPDNVFGDFNMVWWSHMPNLRFLQSPLSLKASRTPLKTDDIAGGQEGAGAS